MSPRARQAYLRFATFFLAIGSVFLMLGVARATFLPDVLRGDPVPVALLLLAIGGGLRWTVRARPGEDDAYGDADGDRAGDDAWNDVGDDASEDESGELDAEADDATIDAEEARGPRSGPRVS